MQIFGSRARLGGRVSLGLWQIVFMFPDASRYTLPPGLCLDGLGIDDAARIANLIRRYDNVFSKGPLDVGCCDLIPHEINVTDATPVGAAYRRVPPHMVNEVKTLLQDLLDQSLIRRSSSNYARNPAPSGSALTTGN